VSRNHYSFIFPTDCTFDSKKQIISFPVYTYSFAPAVITKLFIRLRVKDEHMMIG